jgi:hypothetical protein
VEEAECGGAECVLKRLQSRDALDFLLEFVIVRSVCLTFAVSDACVVFDKLEAHTLSGVA